MRYTGLLTSSASGKAGGIVAYGGPTGQHLRVRSTKVNTRSNAQTARHMNFAAITSNWRSLTDAQRAAWAGAATGKKTGYTLYGSRNLNLFNLGLTPNLTTPEPAPPFPAILSLTATPTYTTGTPQPTLNGFLIAATLAGATSTTARLRATPAYSATRAFTRRGDLRTLALFTPSSLPLIQPLPAWQTIFGTFPPAGTITFEMDFIDPASGAKSPAVKCTASYTAIGPVAPATPAIDAYLPSGEVAVINAPAIYVNTDLAAVAP